MSDEDQWEELTKEIKRMARELQRLRAKVCTCEHSNLPPVFHALGSCPVAGTDMEVEA